MARSPTQKPTFRKYSVTGLVKQVEGSNYNHPGTAYRFSNGKEKLHTDRTENGFYKRS